MRVVVNSTHCCLQVGTNGLFECKGESGKSMSRDFPMSHSRRVMNGRSLALLRKSSIVSVTCFMLSMSSRLSLTEIAVVKSSEK